tara:strand:- start:1016 stop:1549 length:534 start_codon:yes stop_codon:yes gene_type:complete
MNQVDRLLINLKIIASLEPYQKLNTKCGHQLVIEASWSSTSFYRWMRDDTRHNTVKRIGEILEEANNVLNIRSSSCMSTTEYVSDEYMGRVMTQLKETRAGMVNLRTTYESDPTITAHFDVLLERIDTMLMSRYKIQYSNTSRHATAAPCELKINTMSSDDGSSEGELSCEGEGDID